MSTALDTLSELDFDTGPLLCEAKGLHINCGQTNPAAYIVVLHCNPNPILFCEPCMRGKLSWSEGLLCGPCGARYPFPTNFMGYKSITKI